MRNVISLFGASFVVTNSTVTILRHSRDQRNCKREIMSDKEALRKISSRTDPIHAITR